MSVQGQISNFSFLAEHDPLFVELACAAERAFVGDPNTTLIKLRQLGEAMAQHIAVLTGIEFDETTSQADLLYKIHRELKLEPIVRELFHTLRIEGNKAAHQFKTQHKEAMQGLVVARKLAVWFHQSFGKSGIQFTPGPFIPPTDPSEQLRQLQSEIAKLQTELQQANIQLGSSQQLHDLLARERAEYEALAIAMDEESRTLEQQASKQEEEIARQKQEYEAKIKALQAELAAQDEKARNESRKRFNRNTQAATKHIVLDEALTRILIDQQLNEAGWEADSELISYKKGVRPEKGKNLAIAEWPTIYEGKICPADYILFAGLTPIAVVEAKKENVNIAGKITQAERYSRGLQVQPPLTGAWELAGMTSLGRTNMTATTKYLLFIPVTGDLTCRNSQNSLALGFAMSASIQTPNARFPNFTHRKAY